MFEDKGRASPFIPLVFSWEYKPEHELQDHLEFWEAQDLICLDLSWYILGGAFFTTNQCAQPWKKQSSISELETALIC